MIKYIEDDLFNAPQDQLLVHACNCRGVWGSGVAKEFNARFNIEYNLYNRLCDDIYGKYLIEDPIPGKKRGVYSSHLLGTAAILNRVGCLFTSFDYGINVDSPEEIVKNTEKALTDLISKTTMKIAMPKINSGLFKVPWEQTEEILKQFPHVEFYVYTGKK